MWESIQNIPFIIGFIYSTYQWVVKDRKMASLVIMIASASLGSLTIAITEPLIYREPPAFIWGIDVWVNIIVFSILAIAAILYFNWKKLPRWDLLISTVFGTIVTISQAIVDPFPALGIIVHIVAMSLSFLVFMRSTRWAIRDVGGGVLWRAFLINLMGSAIIVVVDYGYLIV